MYGHEPLPLLPLLPLLGPARLGLTPGARLTLLELFYARLSERLGGARLFAAGALGEEASWGLGWGRR